MPFVPSLCKNLAQNLGPHRDRDGAEASQASKQLLIASMLTFPWAKRKVLRRIMPEPEPADLRARCYLCGRCSRNLLSLVFVLVLMLQPPASLIHGAVASEETLSSSRRRFKDPRSTFYDWLGVSRRSSQKEIKKGFKRLAIQMHPDKLGPFESEEAEDEANAIFAKVSASISSQYIGVYISPV